MVSKGEVIDDSNVTNYNISSIVNLARSVDSISLRVTGPTLLYFYSDAAKEDQGFYIEYWYVVCNVIQAPFSLCVILTKGFISMCYSVVCLH